ncbi:MAG: hypothetical protein IKL16_06350 [Clostridia bacterium]|nr:hypothetical protein [Clostridia bacterium]
MKKKLLSLLLVIAVMMTSVSMGFGSLVATAGAAGGGVEAIKAFSLTGGTTVTGTSVNTTINIKSKVSGYQIKVNSITASIRYYQDATSTLNVDVSYSAGTVVGTDGKNFTVSGTISEGLAGLIRYECNYDLLDSSGNVVYAGMTGYGYGAVSANGQQTGAVGTYSAEPPKPGDRYYFGSFNPINSIYVQQPSIVLTSKQETSKNAIAGASSVTKTFALEGDYPNTITVRSLYWEYVEMYGEETVNTTWFEMNTMPDGYYSFTVKYDGSVHQNVEMYYRADATKNTAQNVLNQYLSAGLEKSYYSADSWNKYLTELEKVALAAMAIPGPNYAFRLACEYAAEENVPNGGKLDQACAGLVPVGADYSALKAAYNAFTAVKDNTVSVTTYEAGNEDTGTTTLRLYPQAAVNTIVNKYDGYNENLLKCDQKIVDGYTAEIKSLIANLTYSDAVYTYLDKATKEFDETVQEFENTENPYTSQTWGPYEAAVNAAKDLSRSLKANSQADINSRLASVVEKKIALKYRPANKDALQEQLNIADVIRSENTAGKLYDKKADFADVWAYFDQYYNEALAVKGSEDYNITRQNEVDKATENLRLLNEELANYRVLDTKPLVTALGKKPDPDDESKYVESSYQKWSSLRQEGFAFVDFADPDTVCTDDERKTYADLEEMNRLIELVESALKNLEKVKADFTELRSVVAQIPSEEVLALYNNDVVDAIKDFVAQIDYGATFDKQDDVDKLAADIEAALANLTEANYKDADYTGVRAAIAEAEALDRSEYENFAIVDEAINAVDWTKKIVAQDDVDAMEKAIREAIAMLGFVLANYDDVNAAIAEAEAVEHKEWYANYYRVENIIANIDWNVTLEKQTQVDAYAAAIRQAIKDLKLAEADYSAVEAAKAEANRIEPLSDFNKEFGVALNEAVAAVQAGYTIDRQAEVDAMAERINAVLATADDNLNKADYTRLNVAIAYAEGFDTGEYENYDEVITPVMEAIDWELKCRDTKDKQHTKIMQDQINAIYAAVEKLVLKGADYTAVNDAIDAARAKYEDNAYAEFPYSQESIDAVEAVIGSIEWGYNIKQQSLVDAYVDEIEEAVNNLKYARADYTELDKIIDEYEALERDRYVSLEAVDDYVAKIDMNITVDRKEEVAAYVTGLRALLDALEYLPADYTRITNAENDFNAIIKANRDYYYEEDIDAVEAALDAVVYGLTKEFQDDVNAMADEVERALNALKANMKPADLTALYQARDAANAKYESMFATGLRIDMNTYYVLLDELANVSSYNENTKIQEQADVDSLTAAIIAATEGLEYEFQIIWGDSGLITEGSGTVGEGSYIYGFEEGAMSEDARELLQFVGAAKLEVIETANGFGTGTVIKFKSTKDNSTLAEYTVLVFGDANGDAVIDTFDVAYIAEVVNSGEDPDAVTLRVLDFEVDGVIDAFDVNHVISYANMDATLKQDGSMMPYPEA